MEVLLATLEVAVNFLSDAEKYNTTALITERKQMLKKELLKQIRQIRVRIRGHYGLNSPLFLQLGVKDISHKPTQELLAVCQRIGQLYDENTPAFAAASVTPAVMSAFAAALSSYSASLNEQTAATNTRATSAITRKQQLVEIYETLTKWCLFGQMIWKGENEARYKNYLLTRILKGRKKRKKKAGGKQKKGDE